ncbi:MAG: protein NO VEIN domain-containing protein, partial [Brachybacterium sp.]
CPPCHHLVMKSPKLLAMSNHETENRAIAYVIAHERAAGRTAEDARHIPDSLVDIASIDDATGEKRLIEIKAFGGTGRGDFLWLESNQVEALEKVPGSHLYLATNVRSADSSDIRILDLSGELLRARLEVKREKRYFEVPMPVAVYDDLHAAAMGPPTVTGSEFSLQILEAVTVLHRRGYHRIRFVAMWAPNGLSIRMFVGRDSEVPGGPPRQGFLDQIAFTSLNDADEPARDFAGTSIHAWWSAEMIGDQLLAALPPIEPTADDPAYVAELQELFERHAAVGTVPLAEKDEY